MQSVGGGEPWDNLLGAAAAAGNETVAQALAAREPGKNAVAGQDYQILDQEVTFQVRLPKEQSHDTCIPPFTHPHEVILNRLVQTKRYRKERR